MLKERTHIHYFDYLRVVAAICVVFMHIAAEPLLMPVNIQWHLLNACTSFAFTAVPLFFMMSGYLLLSNSKTRDISILLKKRIPRLLIPFIGWNIIAILWLTYHYDGFSMNALLDRLIASLNSPSMAHFWYMYTIIAIYMISPLIYGAIQSLSKKGHIYVLILIAIVSLRTILKTILPESIAQLTNIDFINKLEFFGGHVCTFVLGYYLGSCKRKIPNWILILGSVITLGIIISGTYYLTVKSGQYNQAFQNHSSGFEVVLAAFIFLLFKQNFNKSKNWLKTIITPLVSLSLAVYMMHNILYSMLYAIEIKPQSFIDVVLVTLLVLIICMVVLKTVATIKPICYLATGMSFKAACNSCNWIYTYRWIKGCFTKKTDNNSSEQNNISINKE